MPRVTPDSRALVLWRSMTTTERDRYLERMKDCRQFGRMTVEFGNLDFMIGLAIAHMAEHLGKHRVPKFTQQKLRATKDWTTSG